MHGLVERLDRSCTLRRVFTHPIDAMPVAVIVAVFVGQLALWWCVRDPVRVMAGVALLFPLQVNLAGMCHNHHHFNTFRHRLANRAFEVVMFLQL